MNDYECADCGLIYGLERLNLVTGDPKDVLENYCPNWWGKNVVER